MQIRTTFQRDILTGNRTQGTEKYISLLQLLYITWGNRINYASCKYGNDASTW